MPRKVPFSIAFDLPFDEAIEAARARKSVLPDAYYHQLPAEARRLAFTVSGLTALDQVQGVLDRMGRHIEDGGTFADFKRLAASQPWELPKHRLETIFRNAVQTAYGAGHWRRFEETKDDQPYLMYDAVNDSRTRPAHRALDGIIRPVDDPFWLTHSPPMGHNCRCTLIQLDAEQAEIRSRNGRGLNQPETPEMRGDDDGWGRKPMQWDETLQWLIEKKGNECQAFSFAGKRKSPPVWCNSESYARVLRASMEGYNKAGGGMPEPRSGAGIERLTSRDPDGLFRRFMREFDGPEYADAIGNVLRIDYQLFESLAGRTKVLKGERAKWLVFTALNIREPDEIWLELGRQGGADKLYYLSRFDVGMRESLACIAVFERHHDAGGQWTGRTNYATTQRGYMDRKRNRDLLHGELKYWRWE